MIDSQVVKKMLWLLCCTFSTYRSSFYILLISHVFRIVFWGNYLLFAKIGLANVVSLLFRKLTGKHTDHNCSRPTQVDSLLCVWPANSGHASILCLLISWLWKTEPVLKMWSWCSGQIHPFWRMIDIAKYLMRRIAWWYIKYYEEVKWCPPRIVF